MRVIQERAYPAQVLLWHTQTSRRTLTLTRDALATESTHEHRVLFKRGSRIDQRVEDLVVARGRHVERLTHGAFFRAALFPPAALESEDLSLAFGELRRSLWLFHDRLLGRAILPQAPGCFWDGGSGVKAARDVRFGDPSDAERQRR